MWFYKHSQTASNNVCSAFAESHNIRDNFVKKKTKSTDSEQWLIQQSPLDTEF